MVSGKDNDLGDSWNSIHVRTSALQYTCCESVSIAKLLTAQGPPMAPTMPMNCSVNRQVILDKHFKIISFVNVDKGTGLLAVNEIHLTTDTV